MEGYQPGHYFTGLGMSQVAVIIFFNCMANVFIILSGVWNSMKGRYLMG